MILGRNEQMPISIPSAQWQKGLTGYCFKYIDRSFCRQTNDMPLHKATYQGKFPQSRSSDLLVHSCTWGETVECNRISLSKVLVGMEVRSVSKIIRLCDKDLEVKQGSTSILMDEYKIKVSICMLSLYC